jgi:hypothetical protein
MTDNPMPNEDRVRALLQRSDGPMVVRPLRQARGRGRGIVAIASALVFTAVVIALAVGLASMISSRRLPVAAPATAVVSVAPSPSVSPSDSGPGFATAQGAADAAKRALEGSDPQLLPRLVGPSGWYARWYAQSETSPMSHDEAVAWLSTSPNATWRVDASTIRDVGPQQSVGDKYITALAIDFAGWAEQRADIVLQAVGGRWYWSSLTLYRPPPLGASVDTVVGYATVTDVTADAITVRFRTVGSRCCSDQSWNGRVIVLRRDAGTIYNKAGGVNATSLVDSGITIGSDVWVQFQLATAAPDGSYRLAWVVAMYP